MIQNSSDELSPHDRKRERDCHLEKWKRACNLNVIKAFAKAFNKGSFLVIPAFQFSKTNFPNKWPEGTIVQIYFRGIFLSHNPSYLKCNVLFPQVDIVPSARLTLPRFLSPDSVVQLVIWLTDNWQSKLRQQFPIYRMYVESECKYCCMGVIVSQPNTFPVIKMLYFHIWLICHRVLHFKNINSRLEELAGREKDDIQVNFHLVQPKQISPYYSLRV